MQRGAASTPSASAPSTPSKSNPPTATSTPYDSPDNGPIPKRRRTDDSPVSGLDTPQSASDAAAIRAAIAAEESKRALALARQAAEVGETEWVMPGQSRPKEDAYASTVPWTLAGQAQLASKNPTSVRVGSWTVIPFDRSVQNSGSGAGAQDSDDESDDDATDMYMRGRRTFGNHPGLNVKEESEDEAEEEEEVEEDSKSGGKRDYKGKGKGKDKKRDKNSAIDKRKKGHRDDRLSNLTSISGAGGISSGGGGGRGGGGFDRNQSNRGPGPLSGNHKGGKFAKKKGRR